MNQWNKAKHEVNALRRYIKSFAFPANNTSVCYLLTKDEITKMLNQKNDGSSLDGLRIYLGAEFIDEKMLPTVHIVACEKDSSNDYHDYNVPEDMNEENRNEFISDEQNMPLLAKTFPCPTHCSKSNILNP